MDENIKKIIKERFDALPESIQEVILSSHYEETLLEIGKQYNLNVEQLGVLERETTLTMMGLTPTKNFENELTRELKVDQTKGSQITKDINEKIFLKIRDLLKLMNTPPGEEPSLEEYDDTIPRNTGIDGDKEIMKSAGIEIIPEKLELNSSPSPLQGEGRGEVEKKEELAIHPILAQKLSGFVKNAVVETEHSLDNLTKNSTPIITPPKTEEAPSSGYKVDPYRMRPE